jgi:formylglycine-generating enzyme required for sulfatase activity
MGMKTMYRCLLVLGVLLAATACSPAPTSTAETNQPAPQVESDPRVFTDCPDCPPMVRIPAGRFTMGSSADEPDRQADEGPQRQVTITKPFAISAFEISTGEYRRFIESTGRPDVDWKMAWTWRTVQVPNAPKHPDDFPVSAVSWQDAHDYAAWLSEKTGQHYRLPTEAEWEYVARAGGPTSPYEPNALRRPLPGSVSDGLGYHYPATAFAANPFGVHGLTANIGEWLEDCYRESYAQAPTDGSAVEDECKQRVVRGAYNIGFPNYERIANRDWGFATIRNHEGIRLARDLP